MSLSKPASAPATTEEVAPWLQAVAEKIHSLRNGTIQTKVHESQVVLVERIEQTRFDLSGRAHPA